MIDNTTANEKNKNTTAINANPSIHQNNSADRAIGAVVDNVDNTANDFSFGAKKRSLKPSKFLLALEVRAAAEAAVGVFLAPAMLLGAAKRQNQNTSTYLGRSRCAAQKEIDKARGAAGDGGLEVEKKANQCVVFYPGLGANDLSTLAARTYFSALGYKCYGWNMGLNKGLDKATLEQLVADIEQISAENNTKVCIVGQSLGGVYAREVAKKLPDHVQQVITLGTPTQAVGQTYSGITNAEGVYKLLNGQGVDSISQQELEQLSIAPDAKRVVLTSVFSKTDGVVSWKSCVDPSAMQNVEVFGASHIGMLVNPACLDVIAKCLQQESIAHNVNYFQHYKANNPVFEKMVTQFDIKTLDEQVEEVQMYSTSGQATSASQEYRDSQGGRGTKYNRFLR